MTIKDLKTQIVEEEKYCDSKSFNKLVKRLLLGLAFFSLTFIVAVDAILGLAFAIITAGICFVLAISLFNGLGESQEVFNSMQKVSKLWFLTPILFVVIMFVLLITNFI